MYLRGLSCIFPVPDITKTAQFYTEKLGFRAVAYLECEEPHICLYLDDAEIILLKANTCVVPNRKLYGYGYDAYLYTAEQEMLEKELIAKEVTFITATFYDFSVLVFRFSVSGTILAKISGN